MATISTKPVGTTQPATQPTEAVKTEKSKASEATSSSIASLAKSETQAPAEKSCWQKVKDCCAKVIDWIKEHILCCFFKKDEAKIEQEKKEKEAKEKEKAEKEQAAKEKKEVETWFASLSPEKQKEAEAGIQMRDKWLAAKKLEGQAVAEPFKKIKNWFLQKG